MTLHKAKGLEFDRVIIPQLDRLPRNDGREILLWDEHSNAAGGRSFLLAADDLGPGDAPTLYNYLKAQRQQKMLLEATRLLYVGATRAVSQLLLTARVRWDEKTGLPHGPSRHSLLSPVWQAFVQQMTVHQSRATPEPANPMPRLPLLTRQSHNLGRPPGNADVTHLPQEAGRTISRPDSHVERSIGIVMHLALAELSGRPVLPAKASAVDQRRWRMALQREGLWREVLEDAMNEVRSCIDQTLQPGHIGRWILSSEHADAHSEWALTTVNSPGEIKDIVIDRSFIDRATGWRWIIDYKNSRPAPGESVDDFTARESATYIDQLRGYCQALRQLGQEPLHCALFFTALGHFHTVPDQQLLALPNGIR